MESKFRPTQSRSTQNDTTPFIFIFHTLQISHHVGLIAYLCGTQTISSVHFSHHTDPPNQTNGPDQILILFLPSTTNTHKQNTNRKFNSFSKSPTLPKQREREREREKWRTLKKQSWATSRRTRLPNGSFSTLLSVKSNTLPKVFFHSLCDFLIFWFLIFDFWNLDSHWLFSSTIFQICILFSVWCWLVDCLYILEFSFLFCLVFLVDVKAILNDDALYNEAASEAFPLYNKSHMICLGMPGRAGDVSLWIYNELLKSLVSFVCVYCLILILGFRFDHLHW